MVNLFIKLGFGNFVQIVHFRAYFTIFFNSHMIKIPIFSNPNQATVEVSDLGDIRTLKIEPKHGISGIYAR